MKMLLLILFGITVVILFLKHKKSSTKITLIDMYYQNGKYTYVYFWDTKNTINKVEFISDIPHLWWTEINKMLLKEIDGLDTLATLDKSIELKYGNISVCKFSEKEKQTYNNFKNIETLLNTAVGKQMAFSEAYDKEYGYPDLHDLH